jgi:hypothetical protein
MCIQDGTGTVMKHRARVLLHSSDASRAGAGNFAPSALLANLQLASHHAIQVIVVERHLSLSPG